MAQSDVAIELDFERETPPYVQIFEQVRALIERGALAAGEAIPTVRQLAGDLGVAPNTVARAYADLKAEGWVVGDERRPTRVASRVPALAKRSRRIALGEAVADFLSSLRGRGYATDEIARELRSRLNALEI